MEIGVIILHMQKSISAILKLVWNSGLHVLIPEIYDWLPRENLRQKFHSIQVQANTFSEEEL
jgi:hypothetical protein